MTATQAFLAELTSLFPPAEAASLLRAMADELEQREGEADTDWDSMAL